MAEYSQTGILTALLLFTIVTVKDIYVGRSMMTQHPAQASDSLNMGADRLRDAEPLHWASAEIPVLHLLRV